MGRCQPGEVLAIARCEREGAVQIFSTHLTQGFRPPAVSSIQSKFNLHFEKDDVFSSTQASRLTPTSLDQHVQLQPQVYLPLTPGQPSLLILQRFSNLSIPTSASVMLSTHFILLLQIPQSRSSSCKKLSRSTPIYRARLP